MILRLLFFKDFVGLFFEGDFSAGLSLEFSPLLAFPLLVKPESSEPEPDERE